jgi:GNAT superfamily N-acetyltransferase
MQFEMDNVLLDDILFYMENQEGDFLLDTQLGQIVDIYNNGYDTETDFDDSRFISLPEWNSSDGYRLMEKFVAGLKNPVHREELSVALNRNKGVFRAFRDVLSQYPEAEKQWYNYKDKQMKNEVIAWYNALREEWGLLPVGNEPEDNTSVVLEDFTFKEIVNENTDCFGFIAENASGEAVGAIKANITDLTLHVNFLEVEIEYRGMGIGKTLLSRLLEKADILKLDVIIDLPSGFDYFSRSLHLENFKPIMQTFFRNRCES